MKNKDILITGGLGFIGSHIVNSLIDDNVIVILDNMSTGNIKNLKNPKHENLKIHHEDIRNVNFDEITSDIDYILHLAALSNVPQSIAQPSECYEINFESTLSLLKSAVKNDVKKIVFSSSSSVYGENENMPLKENETPKPQSPYGISKTKCELNLKSYYDDYGLNYTALRYFNVFGPGQDENSQYSAVIPSFINAILHNKSPVIYGDGNQTRDFVYITDVVNANINACTSDFNGIINVASGRKTTINELFDMIKTALDSDIKPKYLPSRKGDIKYSQADTSNLEKINIEVNPDNFESQIRCTIDWFKSKYEEG